MKRLVLLLPLLSLTVLALPSGKKWLLSTCSTTCSVANQSCVMTRCLPKVRFASSVGNTGGMTINGPSAVPYATALTSMRAAFETWTTPNVTTCSTSIEFSFQPSFATPTGTAAINGNDNNNNVIWLAGTSWRYGSATLGLTTTTFYPGQITDADMELNDNNRWGTTGGSNDTDLQSVVAHEAGHFIGLAHTTSSSAVMNPSIGAGVQKRALLPPNLSDVCSVYPGTTGGQGTACTTSGMCTGTLVCEGASAGALLCTQDCTATGQSCPTGYSCQASTVGFACLPAVGAVDQCRFCLSGADCSTGVCLTSGTGFNFCSQACTIGMAGQCGTGSTCTDNGTGTFCLPTTACTNQCTAATVTTDCAPGYVCTGGTCTPTGAVGDRCEASGFCQACGTCAPDTANPNISYCRACCNGLGQCNGCTATTCGPVAGTPTACAALTGGTERLCFPVAAPGLCQACDTSTPCASGNACVGGLCHAGCNPMNPGACAACLSRGAGSICACASGISEVNQPCSATGTLGICRTGNICLSGFCRKPCGTCDPGFTCTDLAGQTVCVPGVVDAGPTGGGGGGGGATGGGGGSTELCGAANCGGCCSNGQCVQPSDQACGTFGGQCRACSATETCELGACAPAKKKGCGCSSLEGTTALLLALLSLTRRRPGRQ